jgi:ribosomal protein S18 acetylase RimI-like enzyme
MNDEDIRAVSDIVCAGYEWLSPKEGYSIEETNQLCIQRGSVEVIATQKQKCQFFVAEIDGKAEGMVSIANNIITKLYVATESHGKGIGKALFDFAVKYISDQEYDEISLGAFPSSAGFYKAMGMEQVGEKVSAGGPIKGHKMMLFRKKNNLE